MNLRIYVHPGKSSFWTGLFLFGTIFHKKLGEQNHWTVSRLGWTKWNYLWFKIFTFIYILTTFKLKLLNLKYYLIKLLRKSLKILLFIKIINYGILVIIIIIISKNVNIRRISCNAVTAVYLLIRRLNEISHLQQSLLLLLLLLFTAFISLCKWLTELIQKVIFDDHSVI